MEKNGLCAPSTSSHAAITIKERRATTRKGKKYLESVASQLEERPKGVLFISGHQTSQLVKKVLADLALLKKPHSIHLRNKNHILPFESGEEASIEFLCQRNDCSLFILGNHTKKRPNNVVIGRLFDFQLLDMLELGVTEFKSLKEFEAAKQLTNDTKTLICFVGDFEKDENSRKLKNVLLGNYCCLSFHDFEDRQISLEHLEKVIVVTMMHDGSIVFQNFLIQLKKSDTYLPKVVLQETGPYIRFQFRRSRLASEDLWNEAVKRPRKKVNKKQKNMKRDSVLGRTLGRIHLGRQNLDTLTIKKQKAIRKRKREQ
eukprot:jgi/Galph1/1892/GphlegSOOS_G569.1